MFFVVIFNYFIVCLVLYIQLFNEIINFKCYDQHTFSGFFIDILFSIFILWTHLFYSLNVLIFFNVQKKKKAALEQISIKEIY